MVDLDSKLELERMASLAAYAGQPSTILKSIIVTPIMIRAAMDYWEDLQSSEVNEFRLDDIYRIMAATRPKHLADPEGCL